METATVIECTEDVMLYKLETVEGVFYKVARGNDVVAIFGDDQLEIAKEYYYSIAY